MLKGDNTEWTCLTAEEKKRELFLKQKALLDEFLKNGAITQAQHSKSLGDLTDLMNMHGAE